MKIPPSPGCGESSTYKELFYFDPRARPRNPGLPHNITMQIVILGCGTSTGVPVIGCHCRVCSSDDPRNKRTRSSALIQANGKNILIDTSTDLRQQSLANEIERIDAVLFTHPHADHIHGIDDLRSFNMIRRRPSCFDSEHTISRAWRLQYIFSNDNRDGGSPAPRPSWFPVRDIGTVIVPVELSTALRPSLAHRQGGLRDRLQFHPSGFA